MEIVNKKNRFDLVLEDKTIGYLNYAERKVDIDAIFIFVDPAYRGTKAKNILLDELMQLSNSTNKKLHCTCTYMKAWFGKNKPEYLVESQRS
jgi:predicted GNAT family acetyltransferase